ncbi:MAG: GNAT family N-acetyltransferase [Schleiferilactobacillus harbinensis]|jgi:aminoglycoside 6'-N-acetyltransferase I|nr:GNAT family N-acetyltransferase [Schleiferilactobacillus harbinensis]MCI1912884.1 GNAT family N-acetyltransferase [Schleiferilactobacillus harbinensis]
MTQITKVTPANVRALAALQHDLWPDDELLDLLVADQAALRQERSHYWLAMHNGQAVGFCEVTLRQDYVEGSTVTPTGYLEGIYVAPALRQQGIGRQLVGTATSWLQSTGITAMGSDVALTNTVSQHFHKALGFQEVNRLVHYLKDI